MNFYFLFYFNSNFKKQFQSFIQFKYNNDWVLERIFQMKFIDTHLTHFPSTRKLIWLEVGKFPGSSYPGADEICLFPWLIPRHLGQAKVSHGPTTLFSPDRILVAVKFPGKLTAMKIDRPWKIPRIPWKISCSCIPLIPFNLVGLGHRIPFNLAGLGE